MGNKIECEVCTYDFRDGIINIKHRCRMDDPDATISMECPGISCKLEKAIIIRAEDYAAKNARIAELEKKLKTQELDNQMNCRECGHYRHDNPCDTCREVGELEERLTTLKEIAGEMDGTINALVADNGTSPFKLHKIIVMLNKYRDFLDAEGGG